MSARSPRSTVKDIEHAPVSDDPRAWSYAQKAWQPPSKFVSTFFSLKSSIHMCFHTAANAQIEHELHASSSDISWSLSVFVLVQGLFPLVWSAISEIKGRKVVYLSSMSLFVVGSAVVAASKTIGLVIGMRALQAVGSSAVMAIAAATLADIYEPHERGAKMGMYYAAPLLGASMGPFLGGVFAQALGWRAVFWFSLISGAIVLVALSILFKDSFRKERSLTYQNVLRRRLEENQLCMAAQCRINIVESSIDKSQRMPSEDTIRELEAGNSTSGIVHHINDIMLSFKDVDPFPPIILVLKRWNNNIILLASGLIFGFTYSLSYTCARTLSTRYGYDALHTGFILLSSGIGSICGSTLGGRWSDTMLMKLRNKHGGKTHPEMRLQSTLPAMALLPLSALGYAWICQTHQPVAAICVMLFVAGWIYTSTLAYIVDANTGRSSTAVAMNSAYRGILAFIAAEIAIPLQDRIGDGGLYTFWAGLLVIMETLVLLVLNFGNQWREKCEEAERKNV
ncbi:vacuolar DHA amino acid exporter [Boletus edulis BED1]|uniref:Vacuolar DHA amino acid exporter n=1 Tax=Boletus edulis BED1 TaxID=1328754 RepID=A0AAD4BQD4_BOLED|nr:vacuolar DHA amino acid exporter [Boletus edulis BED1]